MLHGAPVFVSTNNNNNNDNDNDNDNNNNSNNNNNNNQHNQHNNKHHNNEAISITFKSVTLLANVFCYFLRLFEDFWDMNLLTTSLGPQDLYVPGTWWSSFFPDVGGKHLEFKGAEHSEKLRWVVLVN